MPSMNQSGMLQRGGRVVRADPALAGHRVLERVHQLVAEHVVGLGQRGADRQHDAPLEGLGDAARALAGRAADGVGLLEVGVARVEDDGLALLELVKPRMRDSRVYQRSAMRPTCSAAAFSSA